MYRVLHGNSRIIAWVFAIFLTPVAWNAARADYLDGEAAFGRSDVVTAFLEINTAAKAGDERARFVIKHGLLFINPNLFSKLTDVDAAVGALKPLADEGDVQALVMLGMIHAHPRKKLVNGALATSYLEQAAGTGDLVAKTVLGLEYAGGSDGVQGDPAEGMAMIREAADEEVILAQILMSFAYTKGIYGKEKGSSFARKWSEKVISTMTPAAKQGQAMVQFFLAGIYSSGNALFGVNKDSAAGRQWLLAAAEQGYVSAQLELAKMYDHGRGVEKNLAEAFQWYGRAAKQGDMEAQKKLAAAYGTGKGLEKDLAKAVYWTKKVAEQGDAPAQYHMGEVYRRGLVGDKDPVQALKWYKKAAALQERQALVAIAQMYEHGEGIPKDEIQAVDWYINAHGLGYYGSGYWKAREGLLELVRRDSASVEAKGIVIAWLHEAAEAGSHELQYELARLYDSGVGLDQDASKATNWYQRAAKQNNQWAQYELARHYEEGMGSKKDLAKAREWYEKAAKQGHQKAREKLKQLSP